MDYYNYKSKSRRIRPLCNCNSNWSFLSYYQSYGYINDDSKWDARCPDCSYYFWHLLPNQTDFRCEMNSALKEMNS